MPNKSPFTWKPTEVLEVTSYEKLDDSVFKK